MSHADHAVRKRPPRVGCDRKRRQRRLARIGRHRRERGTFGRRNQGHRFLLDGFLPDNSTGKPVLKGIAAWLGLELREGWRTRFASEEAPRPRLTDRTAAA